LDTIDCAERRRSE